MTLITKTQIPNHKPVWRHSSWWSLLGKSLMGWVTSHQDLWVQASDLECEPCTRLIHSAPMGRDWWSKKEYTPNWKKRCRVKTINHWRWDPTDFWVDVYFPLHIQNTSLFSCDWCWSHRVVSGNGNRASLPESGQIGQQGPIFSPTQCEMCQSLHPYLSYSNSRWKSIR